VEHHGRRRVHLETHADDGGQMLVYVIVV
jgi:hypothetical protein